MHPLFALSLRSIVPSLSLALLLAAPDARAGSYAGANTASAVAQTKAAPRRAPQSATSPLMMDAIRNLTVGGGDAPMTPQRKAKMAKINDLLQAGTEDLRLKNFVAAETDYRDLVQVDQRGTLGPLPYYGLGEALAGQGKVVDALAVYKKAVYWPLNFSPEAIAASQAIENKPNLCGCCFPVDAVAWMKYALLLSQTGQNVEAFSVYSQAMRHATDTTHPEIKLSFDTGLPSPSVFQAAVHIALGLLVNDTGNDRELALSEFDQALRLAPDAAVTNYYYGYGWQRLDLNDKMKVVDAPQAKAALTKAAAAEGSNISKAAAEVLKTMP